jgi:hypothetical protein
MANSKTYTIRLDQPCSDELERRAAAQNTSGGLLLKEFAETALDAPIGSGPPKEPIDTSSHVAQIAEKLQPLLSQTRDPAIERLCGLMGEFFPAITDGMQKIRSEVSRLRQDLAQLTVLLEAAQSDDDPSPNDGTPGSLLQFDE